MRRHTLDYPELCVYPPVTEYGRGDLRKLRRRLDETDRSTRFENVVMPEEIIIDPSGETRRGGFRFTNTGLSQVASELAPGLLQLVSDIWGLSKGETGTHQDRDYQAALDIFNRVVSTRFHRLEGKLLVVNDRDKLIEGVVTRNYRLFENPKFLETVLEVVGGQPVDVDFHAAILAGRRLILRFKSRKPLCFHTAGTKKYPVHVGYYYRNSEIKGVSVKAARAVFLPHGTATWAAKGGRRTRMAHAGANFENRREAVIRSVLIDSIKEVLPVREQLQKLNSKPLGLGRTPAERDKRIKELTSTICGKSLPQWAARDIMEYAVYTGHGGVTALPSSGNLANRTLFDIFCALVKLAPNYDLDRRETLEHLAYDVLRERISFK